MGCIPSQIIQNLLSCGVYYEFIIFLIKKGVSIKPRTVTKLSTLGQLRHRSVASFITVIIVAVYRIHTITKKPWVNRHETAIYKHIVSM